MKCHIKVKFTLSFLILIMIFKEYQFISFTNKNLVEHCTNRHYWSHLHRLTIKYDSKSWWNASRYLPLSFWLPQNNILISFMYCRILTRSSLWKSSNFLFAQLLTLRACTLTVVLRWSWDTSRICADVRRRIWWRLLEEVNHRAVNLTRLEALQNFSMMRCKTLPTPKNKHTR